MQKSTPKMYEITCLRFFANLFDLFLELKLSYIVFKQLDNHSFPIFR